jgi:phosphoenolpyruvate carboxykinase (ATP)
MTPSPPVRSAQPSPSDLDLTVHGLRNLGPVFANLEPPALIELALARNEAILTDRGALVACTGTHTGRAARDRYLVAEPSSPLSPDP